MHISGIVMENMVISARKGIDIQEASDITFRNVRIESSAAEPLVDILQSDRIHFDGLKYLPGTPLLFRVSGERSAAVNWKNIDTKAAQKLISYELGAVAASDQKN